jgi:hypothetical protein
MDDETEFRLTEHRSIPWLGIVFGYLPMAPFVAGAAGAWLTRDIVRAALLDLTILWAAAILLFLAGVRRGLSFRTPGGPRGSQIATMLGLFCLGLLALLAERGGLVILALGLELVGFAALTLLDPVAAERQEAPLFFARLRPLQMPIAVASLAALLALALLAPT